MASELNKLKLYLDIATHQKLLLTQGRKASASQLRKTLQDIKVEAQRLRKDTLKVVKEMPKRVVVKTKLNLDFPTDDVPTPSAPENFQPTILEKPKRTRVKKA